MTWAVRPSPVDGRASSRGGSGFTPTMIPGLLLWLDAGLGVTLNGSTVSAWADQSGNGNNVVQATGAAQPLWTASDAALGGAPSLTFTAASAQRLGNASFATTAQPLTFVSVFSTDHAAAQWAIIGNPGSACGIEADATSISAVGGAFLHAANSVTVPQVVAAVANGATQSALYINNSQVAAATGNAGTTGTATSLSIGAQFGGSQPLNGKMGASLIYQGVPTGAQLKSLFAYLGARFGVAVS